MKLQSIHDPLAMQMLNSLVMELGALETATGQIRTRLDTLLTLLTAEPVADGDAAEASHLAVSSGDAVEAIVAPIAAEQAGDEVEADEAGTVLASVEAAEVSQSDDAVIGLCARIEATVAEFAAAAEVAHATEAVEDDIEPMLEPDIETAAIVDDVPEVTQPAAVIEASQAGDEAADEVVAASEQPIENGAGEAVADVPVLADASHDETVGAGSDELPQPAVAAALEIDADASPAAANSNVADVDPALTADVARVASTVVALEVKRRVWPQRLAACASVLLIAAAAAVTVAMPDVLGISI
jgi:hypothetical protein